MKGNKYAYVYTKFKTQQNIISIKEKLSYLLLHRPNWEKLNLQMTQIKEWVQRGASEIFINKLKEAIGKEQSRLQRLFFEPPTDRTFEETVSLFSHEGRI